MIIAYWLVTAFILGSVVGSFLNVCVARLPLEKSILWPGSRCGSCFQAIRWYDNLPVVSFLWLGGRCRMCGARFSARYLIVELATGLGFAGLFFAEVLGNIHDWPIEPGQVWSIENGFYPVKWWIVWLYHATLFSFLMVAAVCDLDGREIPLPLTLTGTIVGLVGSVVLAWPFPLEANQAVPQIDPNTFPGRAWQMGFVHPAMFPWPVWGPLPAWLEPGSWKTGLATGLAGALVGTFMMRGVAVLFSRGLGREALGLGDADLMMMAGAFIGWQPIVVAFFLSVIPALVFGIVLLVVKRDNELPFGPSLATGILLTLLGWHWIGRGLQPLFFWGGMLAAVAVLGAVFMLVSSYVIRLSKGSPSG